jgi:hypothetical protein
MPFACDLLPIQLMRGGTQAGRPDGKMVQCLQLATLLPGHRLHFRCEWAEKLPNSRFNHEDIGSFR